MVNRLGGETGFAARQGSIYGAFAGNDGKNFYPLHLWADGALVSLTFRWMHQRPGLRDEAVRQRLLDEMVAIVGPTTTTNLQGFPGFKVALLADAGRAQQLETWLRSALDRMR